MKKLLILSSVLLVTLIISACSSGIDITFEVNGEVHEVRTIEEPGTTGVPIPRVAGYHFLGWFEDEDFTIRFDNQSEVSEDITVYAKTQPHENTSETPLTDMLQLDPSEFEGKTFPGDGIGEVILDRCVDGDTTHFTSNGSFINLRYLFIDTPESTSVVEPWGPASSEYACEVLSNAETIVVEYEPHPENGHPDVHPSIGRLGSFGRHLGTVWYDGRNLNLEMVELGYSYNSGVNNSQYEDYYRWAENNATANNRKIHGEDDPLFEDDPIEVTIADLVANPEDYYYKFVSLEAVFVRQDGSYYLCDDGEKFYLYTTEDSYINNRLGYRARIERLFLTEHRGNYQLTNFNTRNTEVLTTEPVENGCAVD